MSLTIPDVQTDYETESGEKGLVANINVTDQGMLAVAYKDGTYVEYAYIEGYIDTSLPINQGITTVTGIAVNKQNELLFQCNDGSILPVGQIAEDKTDVSMDPLLYKRIDNAYTVMGALNTNIEELTIPLTHKGLPVTSIAKKAFYKYPKLKTVSFANSQVTEIGENAFARCTSLKNVIFKDSSVVTIGAKSFQGCTSLVTLDFSDSQINEIGVSAFADCSSLTSIDFGNTLITEINWCAFIRCTSLECVDFSNSNVKVIKGYAFQGCTSLVTLDFSDSQINEIWGSAFADCTSLSTVVLPSGYEYSKNVFLNTPYADSME